MAASKTTEKKASGGTASKTAGTQESATKTATRNEAEKNKQPSANAPKRSTTKVGDTPAPGSVAQPQGTVRVPTNEGHVDIRPANPAAARVASPRELNPLGVRPPKVYHTVRRGGQGAFQLGGTIDESGKITRTTNPNPAEGTASEVRQGGPQSGDTITKTELIAQAKKLGVQEDEVRKHIESGRLQPNNVAGDRMTFGRDDALAELQRIAQEPS